MKTEKELRQTFPKICNGRFLTFKIQFPLTRVKISQLFKKMCSHCLFPVVDKSGTSCYHQVWYRLHVTSWWQQARSNLWRTACISLVGTTCSKSVTVRLATRQLSLVNFHATLVLVWRRNECWENSHVNSRLSTLMQLLFSFDQAMNVEKTLM
jgi:hypothetical protein